MQTTSELGRFVDGFRDEHRGARDILLGMMQAFRDKDAARFGELMNEMNTDLGAHMRYRSDSSRDSCPT